MAGRRAFLALCWPLHHCLSNLLAEFYPVAFIELSAFMVCADVTLWVLDGPSLIPTVDPCIPRAKRPPSYLGPFLRWLNATIDETADKLAPCVKFRRRPCYFSTPRPTPDTRVKGRFNPFRTCDYVFWCLKYLVAKCNFTWWRFRRCAPSCAAMHLLALSALATGIARANASCGLGIQVSPTYFRFGFLRHFS
jgi:hypothetical protein